MAPEEAVQGREVWDRGGHSIGPRRPIQQFGNCVSNH
jgi:hypothetical protein